MIGKLESDNFSAEDAAYAADHCGADWNEQAERKAKAISSSYRSEILEQLKEDGFTYDQAQYAVNALGY